MDKDTYQATQTQILYLGHIVKDMPLEEFLAAIDRADVLGPILDPTLWIAGHDNMAQIRQLAAGLREFQRAVHEVLGERGG